VLLFLVKTLLLLAEHCVHHGFSSFIMSTRITSQECIRITVFSCVITLNSRHESSVKVPPSKKQSLIMQHQATSVTVYLNKG